MPLTLTSTTISSTAAGRRGLCHVRPLSLSGESTGMSGYVMAHPDLGDKGATGADDDGETDPLTSLRRDLALAKGKTTFAPTMRAGYDAGASAAPEHDYKSTRYGINPPTTVVELRRDVERSILSACGVPPVLASHAAPGGSAREAWRMLHQLLIEPLAELLSDQLSEALGETVRLDMRRARAADIATMARAVGSLTTAGVEPAEARRIVGV